MKKMICAFAFLLCTSAAFADTSANEVPVLMYHRVNATISPSDTAVSPQAFAAQLDALQKQGYTTITIDKLTDFMNRRISLPEKTIAITFDDGWADNNAAIEELNKRNMSATFYIITAAFGDPSYFSKDEVVNISNNPRFQIGAHTHTHFVRHADHLKDEVSTEMLVTESLLSKVILEQLIQKPVNSLAWPYSYTTDEAIDLSAKNGFTSTLLVTRTAHNTVDDSSLRIKRVTVDGRCNLQSFINMVKTATIQECSNDGKGNSVHP
jgi:peptidoglycan/xylan/chitin deacetylase (PgdA/CDA1 family)